MCSWSACSRPRSTRWRSHPSTSGASSASTAHSRWWGCNAGRPRRAHRHRRALRARVARAAGRGWVSSVDDPDAGAGERRYGLPAAYRPVFVDEEDLNHLTPLATLAIGVCGPMGALLEAYRTGAGVPYEAYEIHEAIGAINRPQFVNELAGWLASIPELHARLGASRPPRGRSRVRDGLVEHRDRARLPWSDRGRGRCRCRVDRDCSRQHRGRRPSQPGATGGPRRQ